MSTEIFTEEQWEAEGLGIAGRQLVQNCTELQKGDMIIDTKYHCRYIANEGKPFDGQKVYRKMPVTKQGDLDHSDSKSPLVPTDGKDKPCDCKAEPNIAEKAIGLVCGDRNASYGNPADDYAGTAKVWSGLLHRKLKEDITAREAILMMAAMKINREIFKPKEDSRIDAIGYMLCADWATTGKQP